jgi:hypothetical protein
MLRGWLEQAPENCFEHMWQMGEMGCAEVVGVVCSSMQWRDANASGRLIMNEKEACATDRKRTALARPHCRPQQARPSGAQGW